MQAEIKIEIESERERERERGGVGRDAVFRDERKNSAARYG